MKYALVTVQNRKTIHNTMLNDKIFLNTDSIRDQKRRFEISGKWDEGDLIVRVGNFYTILFFSELTSFILFVFNNLVYRIYSIRCQFSCLKPGCDEILILNKV